MILIVCSGDLKYSESVAGIYVCKRKGIRIDIWFGTNDKEKINFSGEEINEKLHKYKGQFKCSSVEMDNIGIFWNMYDHVKRYIN